MLCCWSLLRVTLHTTPSKHPPLYICYPQTLLPPFPLPHKTNRPRTCSAQVAACGSAAPPRGRLPRWPGTRWVGVAGCGQAGGALIARPCTRHADATTPHARKRPSHARMRDPPCAPPTSTAPRCSGCRSSASSPSRCRMPPRCHPRQRGPAATRCAAVGPGRRSLPLRARQGAAAAAVGSLAAAAAHRPPAPPLVFPLAAGALLVDLVLLLLLRVVVKNAPTACWLPLRWWRR